MNIITTAKSVGKIEEYLKDLSAGSVVFVLYEPDEELRAADIAMVYDTHAKLVFIRTESRDDKLLCIGGIKVRMDCVTLDDELNGPSEFLEKINNVFDGNNSASRSRSQSPDFVMQQRRASTSGPSSIKEAMTSAGKQKPVESGMNLSKKAQVLYDAIGIKAKDVGFVMGTDALMQAIASVIVRSGSADEACTKVLEMDGGELIWSKLAPKYNEMKQFFG